MYVIYKRANLSEKYVFFAHTVQDRRWLFVFTYTLISYADGVNKIFNHFFSPPDRFGATLTTSLGLFCIQTF